MNTTPQSSSVETDVVIVGGGPSGLFAAFELGLYDMKVAIVDILDRAGGQCTELYPEKPIFDIPAVPSPARGPGLSTGCWNRSNPLTRHFILARWPEKLEKLSDRRWQILTVAARKSWQRRSFWRRAAAVSCPKSRRSKESSFRKHIAFMSSANATSSAAGSQPWRGAARFYAGLGVEPFAGRRSCNFGPSSRQIPRRAGFRR